MFTGREMNIQVATSEIPVPTTVRGGSRLGGNFAQRPQQQRFRGTRGTGSARGKKRRKIILIINRSSYIDV